MNLPDSSQQNKRTSLKQLYDHLLFQVAAAHTAQPIHHHMILGRNKIKNSDDKKAEIQQVIIYLNVTNLTYDP